MTDRLSQHLAALEKSIKQKAKRPQTAKVVQLPFWPEPTRGVPSSALRGALFAAIQGKDRQYLKGELLAVQQGVEIRFTGMQLDQSDLDVWEQALHLARHYPLGTHCNFTAHAFLKALGRKTGKKDHEWLKDVFRRLMGCGIEVTHGRFTYGGSLLEFVRDEVTGRYVVHFNPTLSNLYDAGWTAIEWQQRQTLRRKPLALWLHGYYATHAEPYPVKVETLKKLSGSRTKEVWKFKQNLKTALDEVKAIGAINGYEIDGNDLVIPYRTPSDTRRRHLTKGKPRKRRK